MNRRWFWLALWLPFLISEAVHMVEWFNWGLGFHAFDFYLSTVGFLTENVEIHALFHLYGLSIGVAFSILWAIRGRSRKELK
jgi:hypothetical protein